MQATTVQTTTGQLKYGVEYNGTVYYDFELRLPVVADTVAAFKATGVASNMEVKAVIFSRCLTKLGDIPADEITYDLLANSLLEDDFDALAQAEEELKKKRLNPNLSSAPGDVPSSSLADTVSPSPASTSAQSPS